MKLQRHMVQLETLNKIYNVVEGLIPHIGEDYPKDVRRQGWAVEEINHVLRSVHKWANTIEANNEVIK